MDEMFLKSKAQINEMCDSGMFNSIIEGYTIFAMQKLGIEDGVIKRINFDALFDRVNANTARKTKSEFWNGLFD